MARKRTTKQEPEPVVEEMTAEEHRALEEAELAEGTGEEEPEEEPEEPPVAAKPKQAKPRKVEEKTVKLPRRDLGGQYRCKARVSHGGTKHLPGTVITLTDKDARHFLRDAVIESVED